MGTTVARLEAVLTAQTRDFDRAMDRSEGKMHNIGKVAGVAGVAIAAGLAYGLEKSIKAAMEAQVTNARLAVAFKNAGLNAGAYRKQVDLLESSGRKLGFTDEQTKDSLGSLLTATRNMSRASKDLSVAQDLARFKHIGLNDATKMLTMAMTGSQRAAKQLGISVQPVTTTYDALKATMGKTIDAHEKLLLAEAKLHDKQLTGIAVVDAVRDHVKGQGDAYAKTAAGAMEQFKAQLAHIEVAIGEKLLPVMTKAIQYVVNHWPQITAAIQQGWDAIKPILTGLMDLFVSVVQVIRRHWSTIGPIVMDVVRIVRTAMAELTTIIKLFTDVLHGNWSAAWQDVKRIVSLAFTQIENIFRYEKDVLFTIAKTIGTAIWQGLKAGFEGGAKAIEGAVTGLFDKVIGWAKDALGIKSPSAVFHGIGQSAIRGFINGVGSMAGALKSAVVGIAEHAATSLYHGAGSLLHGGAAHGSQQNRNIGQQIAARYGWSSGAEWLNLDALFNQESGWSNTAKNPSSGAYGIAQALPPTKMPFAAQEAGGSNAAAQIIWGLNYIKGRYGDPIAAMAHEQQYNWYDKGGWLPTGLSLAMNNTGRPERVLGPQESGDIVIPVSIGGEHVATVIFDMLRRKAKVFENRNGRPAFGGA